MNDYYKEIEHLIKRNEVNKQVRKIQDNSEDLNTKWEIGRLLVEAQGGERRAKYGDKIIREWSKDFSKLYGSGYNTTNLKRYRQFFLSLGKSATVWHLLTWSHIREILPVKNENERNYYINLCASNNLSVRALQTEIKNNSYDRLIDKPNNVELINFNNDMNIRKEIKNPILIHLNEYETINNEKELQLKILSNLQAFFLQLGNGFTLVGNEYKIINKGKLYFIDILLFNYEFNHFVVVELKFRELRQSDKGEIELYMKLVDKHIKKHFHGNTIGIIISKEQEEFIATYVSEDDIIPLTYRLFD